MEIETHGGVLDSDVSYLGERLHHVLRPIADRTVRCRVLMSIHHERQPGAQARVQVSIHIPGGTIRSEVIAPTVHEGISAVEARLRRQIEHRTKRAKNDPRGVVPDPGAWRHGNLRSPRSHGYTRHPNDRELVAKKSPATPASTLEEARWDRFVLDYDFFLFVDIDTGRDMLLAPDEGGDLVLDVADAPTKSVDEARLWLEESGQDFHFFEDAATERAAVVYRRYDGHDGLLTPGDVEAS